MKLKITVKEGELVGRHIRVLARVAAVTELVFTVIDAYSDNVVGTIIYKKTNVPCEVKKTPNPNTWDVEERLCGYFEIVKMPANTTDVFRFFEWLPIDKK